MQINFSVFSQSSPLHTRHGFIYVYWLRSLFIGKFVYDLVTNFGAPSESACMYLCMYVYMYNLISHALISSRGTLWRSWLRHYATSRKIADSIPD
jgi:hypothetical protein